MSDPVKFIDELNQAIYGDDWTMEKAEKALQDVCGVSDLMLGKDVPPAAPTPSQSPRTR